MQYPLQETAISGNRLQTLEAVHVTQAVGILLACTVRRRRTETLLVLIREMI